MSTPLGTSAGKVAPAAYVPLAVLACFLWGSAFAAIKIALETAGPMTVAALRYVIAGLILIPFLPNRLRSIVHLRRSWGFILMVSLLQTVVVCGVFTIAMQWTKGAQGAILIGVSPLISAITAHFLMSDDRMSLAKVGVISLGLAGVVIIALASKPWEPAGLAELGGMALIVIVMASEALSNVVIAKRRKRVSPLLLNSLQMGLGGLVFIPLALAFEGLPQSVPPLSFILSILYMAAVSATAFSIWFHLLRTVKVSQLSVWKFLIPLFGATLSWILLPDESPTVWTVTGMVLVALSVLLNARKAGATRVTVRVG